MRRPPHSPGRHLPLHAVSPRLSINTCGAFFDVPEQATALTCLLTFKLTNCSFLGLPDSFDQMPALSTLVLHKLNTHFPGSCCRLKSLETLVVTDCAYLGELPDPLSALTALKTPCLADSPLLILPDGIGGLTDLHTLYLKSYRARNLLLPSFTKLASLTRLELHECELVELPDAIGGMRRLRELYQPVLRSHEPHASDDAEAAGADQLLGSYPEVTHLPGTYALPNLNTVSLSIVIFPSALSRSLSSLEHLCLVLACEGELPFPLANLPCLRTLALVSTGVVKLPDFSTSMLQELRQLELCLPELTEIPSTIVALHKLTHLEINAPKLPALPDSIGALSRLCKLILSNCLVLTHLPGSLTQLAHLRELSMHKAAIKSLPPNFACLGRLQAAGGAV
ncbi:unnamed protein product [Closterium sp. NIES-54]